MSFSQNQLRTFSQFSCGKIQRAKLDLDYFEEPFKHIVIDDFLPLELAEQCLNNFPELMHESWEHSNDEDVEVKSRSTWKSEFDIPDGIVDAVRIMNGSQFLEAVGNKLGIEKLLPDPYFTGGGLNVTKKNGLLDVHVDGNYHDATGLNRRVNALLYFNKNWEPNWLGEFGLFDETGETCLKKIEPIFNRLVVFDTHDKSFHGLPDPVNFPDDEPRRSIILYYYTKENRPSAQVEVSEPHSALWKKRGFRDKKGNRTREYR